MGKKEEREGDEMEGEREIEDGWEREMEEEQDERENGRRMDRRKTGGKIKRGFLNLYKTEEILNEAC